MLAQAMYVSLVLLTEQKIHAPVYVVGLEIHALEELVFALLLGHVRDGLHAAVYLIVIFVTNQAPVQRQEHAQIQTTVEQQQADLHYHNHALKQEAEQDLFVM